MFYAAVIILLIIAALFSHLSHAFQLPYSQNLRRQRPHISDRVFQILSTLTVEEKARQLDMYNGGTILNDSTSSFSSDKAKQAFGDAGVGAIHDLYPRTADVPNSLQAWLKNNSRAGIPALFIEECLHGMNERDHTVFPQSIAMGVSAFIVVFK
jgi:beta-glucosidase